MKNQVQGRGQHCTSSELTGSEVRDARESAATNLGWVFLPRAKQSSVMQNCTCFSGLLGGLQERMQVKGLEWCLPVGEFSGHGTTDNHSLESPQSDGFT